MRQTFITNCPVCSKEFSVSTSWDGKEIECPKCKTKFTVQAPVSEEAADWKRIVKNYREKLKDSLKEFFRKNKKNIRRIAWVLLGIFILFLGCSKAYSIYKEQLRRAEIAEEKKTQEKMINKLRRYTKKAKKKPYFIIQKVFSSYNSFFRERKIKYVNDSIEDILKGRFNMDLPPAKETEEELISQIDAEVKNRFPLSEKQYREKIAMKAEKIYKMLNHGDKITVFSPRFKPIKGTFYGFSETSRSIRVNSRIIALIDLTDDTRAMVDKQFNLQVKKKYIEKQCAQYHDSMIQFSRYLKNRLFRERGYIDVMGRFYSPKEYLDKLQGNDTKPREAIPEKKENNDDATEDVL